MQSYCESVCARARVRILVLDYRWDFVFIVIQPSLSLSLNRASFLKHPHGWWCSGVYNHLHFQCVLTRRCALHEFISSRQGLAGGGRGAGVVSSRRPASQEPGCVYGPAPGTVSAFGCRGLF